MVVLDAVIFARGGAQGVNVESFTPHAAFSGPLGIAVLFALTGFIGARNPRLADGKVWQTRIAPVLAVLGLLASLWLVLANFTLVTGGSMGVSIVLGIIPFAAFAAGIARGPKKSPQPAAQAPSARG